MSWPAAYGCAPGLEARAGEYGLRPIHWDDREAIRRWRNDQLDILRQVAELSTTNQDVYFHDVVEPQFAMPSPPQILVGFTLDDELVGYGGIVHINWPDRRGEVSFLSATDRLDADTFRTDWTAFLTMLVPLARNVIGLHKLTTEAYDFRTDLFPLLEEHGFVLEGTMREHHRLGDAWVTSVAHGLILGS
jgi:RimJ/RimL family protein N-acetyltransferase